jgi:tRNA (guanine37-N1)-methyltransferase
MRALHVPLATAEHAKRYLLATKKYGQGYGMAIEADQAFLPVAADADVTDLPFLAAIVDKELPFLPRKVPTLREALAGKLPAEALEELATAYDMVGTIAILEVDEALKPFERLIGETLLSLHPSLSTILAKDTGHTGTFRTQKMRLLAGVDTRVTLHKENGIALEVDVEAVYYSSRLSTERKRIASLVKPGESVLVLFAGCGPYTCALAKNTLAHEVMGVEINPAGHELAVRNLKRNKLKNATTLLGDVREVLPGLLATHGPFDRVLMPLPKTGEEFLDVCLPAVKAGGTLHFYAFLPNVDAQNAVSWVQEACSRAGRSCTILDLVRCGQQAPRVSRFCVDASIR